MPPKSKISVSNIDWKANNHEKTWLLLKEAQKDQNYVLLFGLQKNQKTTKDSKIAVAKRIASVVLPVQYAQDQDVAGSRLKGKADEFCAWGWSLDTNLPGIARSEM
ncbi:hypothetical protein DFP72DRAFT_891322 [Ephemerocybe angulata]|uniref:Uncharacterized protein n=1 Tax=Ephemerocybe angulata TaxID=980116 RepID=A0A8H6M943_9AGAR|nr:hypothetical protein DFP72DRAFT_891322 [Tulosesus angulatus]